MLKVPADVVAEERAHYIDAKLGALVRDLNRVDLDGSPDVDGLNRAQVDAADTDRDGSTDEELGGLAQRSDEGGASDHLVVVLAGVEEIEAVGDLREIERRRQRLLRRNGNHRAVPTGGPLATELHRQAVEQVDPDILCPGSLAEKQGHLDHELVSIDGLSCGSIVRDRCRGACSTLCDGDGVRSPECSRAHQVLESWPLLLDPVARSGRRLCATERGGVEGRVPTRRRDEDSDTQRSTIVRRYCQSAAGREPGYFEVAAEVGRSCKAVESLRSRGIFSNGTGEALRRRRILSMG